MEHPNITAIRTWFEFSFLARDRYVVTTMRDALAVSDGIGDGPLVGSEAFLAFHDQVAQLLRFDRMTVDQTVMDATGDRVGVIIRSAGKTVAGRAFTFDGGGIVEFRNGKILHASNLWNTGSLAAALGLPSHLSIQALMATGCMQKRLFIDEYGFGDNAVVLLHGTPTSVDYLDPLVKALAPDFRVLVPHLPGYGRSPRMTPCVLDDVSALLEEALAVRGVTKAAVVGFSGGSYRAFDLALRGKLAVTKLVSLGTTAGLDDPEREGFRQIAGALRAGVDFSAILPPRFLAPTSLTNPDRLAAVGSWLAAVPSAVLADEMEAFANAPDLRPRLGELTCPVLLRNGALDGAAPPAATDVLGSQLRQGTVETVPDVGHALLVEDAAGTAGAVKRFLA